MTKSRRRLTGTDTQSNGAHAAVGRDAAGKSVHIGDTVRHTKKQRPDAVVVSARHPETEAPLTYGAEAAVVVRYPDGGLHLNRLSLLVVVQKAANTLQKPSGGSRGSRGGPSRPRNSATTDAAMRKLARALPKAAPGPPPSHKPTKRIILQGGLPETNRRRTSGCA